MVAEGWSKRQLEDAALTAGAPRARTGTGVGVSADQRALADRLGEAVSRSTGLEIVVKATGGEAFAFTVRGAEAAHRVATLLSAGSGDGRA